MAVAARRHRIDCGGSGAAVAEPYAMTCVRAWPADGLFAVMRGGGGGAAQMMPADALAEIGDAAQRATAGAPAPERLARWIGEVDARIAALRAGLLFRGSSAEATAIVVAGDTAWVGNVGLGRCYQLGGQGLVQLTRDDSVLCDARDAGDHELDASYGNLPTVALGVWRAERPGWQPRSIALAGGADFVIATREADRAATQDELAAWSRDAFAWADLDRAAAELWRRLRSRLAAAPSLVTAEFERRAAVMLLRCH
jgi:hypothetical protein